MQVKWPYIGEGRPNGIAMFIGKRVQPHKAYIGLYVDVCAGTIAYIVAGCHSIVGVTTGAEVEADNIHNRALRT